MKSRRLGLAAAAAFAALGNTMVIAAGRGSEMTTAMTTAMTKTAGGAHTNFWPEADRRTRKERRAAYLRNEKRRLAGIRPGYGNKLARKALEGKVGLRG